MSTVSPPQFPRVENFCQIWQMLSNMVGTKNTVLEYHRISQHLHSSLHVRVVDQLILRIAIVHEVIVEPMISVFLPFPQSSFFCLSSVPASTSVSYVEIESHKGRGRAWKKGQQAGRTRKRVSQTVLCNFQYQSSTQPRKDRKTFGATHNFPDSRSSAADSKSGTPIHRGVRHRTKEKLERRGKIEAGISIYTNEGYHLLADILDWNHMQMCSFFAKFL